MTSVRLSRLNLLALMLILILALAAVEYVGLAGKSGALLVTLVFWTAVLQGAIASVAIADLIGAKWVHFLRRELLSLQPLLLLPVALMALFGPQVSRAYPWMAHQNAWLNPTAFLTRNLLALFVCYLVAGVFRRHSLAGHTEARKTWAVLYLATFIICQNLVGYDWVMPLEYPWISSLFGPFFAIESLFLAFALATLLFALDYRRKLQDDPVQVPERFRDLGVLMYGFSVLWGGFFFAQFLLIWYGNLPEEVGYMVRRVTQSPFREMSYALVFFIFVAPFGILTPGKNKRQALTLSLAAFSIGLGMFTEKILYILPAFPFDQGALLLENGLVAVLVLLVVHSRDRLLPDAAY